jgi:hypothetical protein
MIDMPFRQRFMLNSEMMTRWFTMEDAYESINALSKSGYRYEKESRDGA